MGALASTDGGGPESCDIAVSVSAVVGACTAKLGGVKSPILKEFSPLFSNNLFRKILN